MEHDVSGPYEFLIWIVAKLILRFLLDFSNFSTRRYHQHYQLNEVTLRLLYLTGSHWCLQIEAGEGVATAINQLEQENVRISNVLSTLTCASGLLATSSLLDTMLYYAVLFSPAFELYNQL